MCYINNKKNTIYDLLGTNCINCSKYKNDEIIFIGNKLIKIYPIFKGCKYTKHDIALECFNERLSKMLIEVSNYFNENDDYIFLWSSDGQNEFIYDLGLFDAFINQGLNFCIIY